MTIQPRLKQRCGRLEKMVAEKLEEHKDPLHAAHETVIGSCGKCQNRNTCTDYIMADTVNAKKLVEALHITKSESSIFKSFVGKIGMKILNADLPGPFSAIIKRPKEKFYRACVEEFITHCGNCVNRLQCLDLALGHMTHGKDPIEAVILTRANCKQLFSWTIKMKEKPPY